MLIKDCNEEEAKNLIEGFTMKNVRSSIKGKNISIASL